MDHKSGRTCENFIIHSVNGFDLLFSAKSALMAV